jgi:AAA15 family ATPase/GTPase
MLLSFSVENFRSFRAEETLNLLASSRLSTTPGSPHCHEVAGTGEHVLRVASLYGANGAGKSNLVRAIRLLERLVLHGTPPGKPISYTPFVLDGESPTKPSSLELQFVEKGEVFRYGICYDAERIHEEWLAVYRGKKEHNVFTRLSEEDGTTTVGLGPPAGGASFPRKIKALAEVGARPNQLFLTEVVNLDDPGAQGPRFHRVVDWFNSTLQVIQPDAQFRRLAETIATDDKFAAFAGRFLREASTGIASLDVQTSEVSRSELFKSHPKALEGLFDDLSHDGSVFIRGPHGEEMFVDESRKNVVIVRNIGALHDSTTGNAVKLPLGEESDGSRRLLHLLPALYRIATESRVFVIDELERSMHPMLARKFIEFFLKAVPATGSQLIFTTHESTLLDLDLMRRDGIWFAEKDQKGATHLYSLADFKVRNDLRVEKGYLAGRFGAIPFLGGIDHLIEERAAEEAKA